MKLSVQMKSIRLKAPFRVAFGTISGLEAVEVRVERDGVVGRGECCPMAIYDQTPHSVLAEIKAISPAVESGAVDRIGLQVAMPARSARNALDCALWDLDSRMRGVPAWQLAGVGGFRPLPTTMTIGADTPDVMAAAASRRFGDWPMLKLKLTGEEALDAERLRAVRAIRPDAWIGVDANQGYTIENLPGLIEILIETRV